MNHAITIELQFFLTSILSGAILILVYDGLRIFRRLIKHDGFFIALEDLFFWVGASLFIFAMMYEENDGIIRGFSVMGMAIGMVLYHYILSDFIVNLITKIINLLISPIVFIIKKVKKIIKFLSNMSRKIMNFVIMQLKKWTNSVRITLNKRKRAAAEKRQEVNARKMQEEQKKNEIKQTRKQNKKLKNKKKVSNKKAVKAERKKQHKSSGN